MDNNNTPTTAAEWAFAAGKHYAEAKEAFTIAIAYGNELPNPGLERARVAMELARFALDRASTAPDPLD